MYPMFRSVWHQDHDAILLLCLGPDLLDHQARRVNDCVLLPFSAFSGGYGIHYVYIKLGCCHGGVFVRDHYPVHDDFETAWLYGCLSLSRNHEVHPAKREEFTHVVGFFF